MLFFQCGAEKMSHNKRNGIFIAHAISKHPPQLPAVVVQLDARPTGDKEVAGSIPAGSAAFFRGDLIMIQEGQYTILVYRLQDLACPVKVQLSKLTALDMTLLR